MKQNNIKIAITGGIGSGKSTVAHIIENLGYPVFSCDEVYQDLTQQGDFLSELQKVFGDILNGAGGLDREKLSRAVFGDEEKLQLLNSVTHPAIFREMFSRCKHLNGVCFFEVPLLFENGYEAYFDGVIVVLRDLDKRVESVMKRDNLCRDDVLKRVNCQYNYDSSNFAKYYVTHNNGDLKQLKEEIHKILEEIQHEK